jgi:hypothetical protein
MAFELLPKTNPERMVTISTQDMCLLKTLMMHAKVDIKVILKFTGNNKALIGEKVGKTISSKLQELMPRLASSNVIVQRKEVIGDKVELISQPLDPMTLLFVQGFIFFNDRYAPYEVL